MLFILYLIFPMKNKFNYQGRMWVFWIVKEVFATPFRSENMCFSTSFYFSQTASFMILFNDFI